MTLLSPLKVSFLVTLALVCVNATQMTYADPVTDLSIEDLIKMEIPAATEKEQIKKKMLNVKVSSVAKASQTLSNAAAAVYVIDNEAIKRSGVTSVPEALRMAPGIDVARINNSKWAITARGFNGRFANKLLVLIDGRSVYTPDFSGVYWDAQDVMLEDVDRIEVIRGPGATLWGANAMNGVINIITKHAEDTQGGLLTAGGGTKETGFGSLRYGTKLGDEAFARAYAKGFLRDEFTPEKTNTGNAEWNQFQGGFRIDSALTTQDNLMVQGNVYKGQPNQTLETFASPVSISDNVDTSGWNLTSRFNHTLSSTADYSLQFYYDHYQRDEFSIDNVRDTLDLDFQNTFALGEQQNVIWGMGYRYSDDRFKDQKFTVMRPKARNTQLFSGFIQDEFSLFDDSLLLTLGSKFEHNDYTGFEIQPSASVMWTPVTGHKIWASVSRAVRTPSRTEANGRILLLSLAPRSESNPFAIRADLVALGNAQFKAEQQLSYQLGYRWIFNNDMSLDVTAFYNDYNTLRSASKGAVTYNFTDFANISAEQEVNFNNISTGNAYGFEMSSVWQMLDWWRWDLNYSLLKTEIKNIDYYQAAFSPEHMTSLRSSIVPMESVTLDFWIRHSSAAKTINPLGRDELNVNSYVTLDVRLAWQPVTNLELSIAGQNLLEKQHVEYFDESYALHAGVPRSVYGKISWQF
ncbi:MAG: TonB-dependent receptor [Methylococcales bacterium]